jgi:multiple sugar transport system permease protein
MTIAVPPRAPRRHIRIDRLLCYGALIGIVALFLAPVVWIIITSFQPYALLTSVPPKIDLRAVEIQNYKDLLGDAIFRRAFVTTTVVTFGATLMVLLVAVPAGYAVGRLQFHGKASYLFSILAMQFGPAIAFLIPLFIMMRRFGLVDTHLGLMLVFLVFVAPVGVWLLRGFFEVLPPHLERAARIDGASRFRAFYQVILPLATAGVWATAIVAFIGIWGDLLVPLALSFSRAVTLTVVASAFAGEQNVNYGGAAAAAVLSAFPSVLLALIFRRYLVRGLTEGAIKQ